MIKEMWTKDKYIPSNAMQILFEPNNFPLNYSKEKHATYTFPLNRLKCKRFSHQMRSSWITEYKSCFLVSRCIMTELLVLLIAPYVLYIWFLNVQWTPSRAYWESMKNVSNVRQLRSGFTELWWRWKYETKLLTFKYLYCLNMFKIWKFKSYQISKFFLLSG